MPADGVRADGSGRRAVLLGAASLALLVLLAALGDSAAVPGLGPATPSPPWDVAAHPDSATVTILGVLAYLLGGLAVWSGLRGLRGLGEASTRWPDGVLPLRWWLAAGIGAALLLTLVPPAGSADHLSYLAYGRISAAGDDAYLVAPIDWRGGTDPVAGAVQPPWQHTPSVYGPLATALFALVARLGGGSLRLSVWCWSLVCALAFVAVAVLLDRVHRGDDAARARAAVLWTLNPVVLGQLVLGAHVDVVATALAVTGLVVAARWPAPAGMLLGAAAAVKAPYALFGLAVVWSLRAVSADQRRRVLANGLFGAVLVVVPAYAWAGPHVADQLRTASGFTSIASPWRAVVNLVELAAGRGAMRAVVVPLALLATAGLVWLLRDRLGELVRRARAVPGGEAAAAAVMLCIAWVLCAPYALPWYDAMIWAPLALVPAAGTLAGLESVLLVRLTVLSLAYLPGRVVGLSPTVETVTLGFRRYVAPVVLLSAVLAVVRWAAAGRHRSPGP